jgi:putative copper resistance protein D
VVPAAAATDVTARGLVLDWSLDPLPAIALVVAVVLYAGGVRRLGRRHRPWPRARTASFVAGCAVVAVALLSGVAAYDQSHFSVHVVQHLLLAMVAAVLFALSAPVTLALQAGSRTTQRRVLAVLNSKVVRAVTHPVPALLLFGGSLFVLYFSELYALSIRHQYVHDLVHLHFLLVGIVFFWPVVGLDVMRARMPYGARLLYVMVAVPFHAFLGIALLSTSSPLFSNHALSDQRAGAGILWAVGDLLTLTIGAIVLSQWMAHEERVAAREDRRFDAGALGDGAAWTATR